MNITLHLAVWLDHRTARLLTLSRQGVTEQVIHNENVGATGHVHHHSGTVGSGPRGEAQRGGLNTTPPQATTLSGPPGHRA